MLFLIFKYIKTGNKIIKCDHVNHKKVWSDEEARCNHLVCIDCDAKIIQEY